MRRAWPVWLILLVWAAALLIAHAAGAQTTYNPVRIEFTSPDHDTMVTSYVVEYWLEGVNPDTGAPYSTSTLPKAALAASTATPPVYTAPLTALVPLPAIQVGKTYLATVRAVGAAPTDVSARSALSNPFALAPVPQTPAGVSLR